MEFGKPLIYLSLKLNERQSRVLCLGLKFRPSLQPRREAQFDSQIHDFCRRVRLQDKFANCPEDKDFNSRLYVPTNTATEESGFCVKLIASLTHSGVWSLRLPLSLVSISLHLSYETSPLQGKHNSMKLIRQLCILGFH